jgi:hypothetical protein
MLAVGLTILAQGAAGAAGTNTPRLTKPLNATKDDLNPGRLYLAPSLAVDPSNPLHVGAAMTELRTKSCFFMRSADGGQTWTRPQNSPGLSSYPFCNTSNRGSYEAQIAYGRGGNIYQAFPGWDTQDAGTRGNVSLLVARSSDFGDSWQTVVARDNRGKQGLDAEGIRPVGSIAVDAKSSGQDVVYVGYASRLTNAAAPNAAPNAPSVVVSTDGGRHFSAPINLAPTAFGNDATRQAAISAATTTTAAPNASTTTTAVPPAGSRAAQPNQVANFGGFQPVVTVDNKGTVYAVWPSSTASINPSPPTGLFVSKSTDKGKTWTTNQVGTFDYRNGSFLQMAWSPKGGQQGTLDIVYPASDKPEVSGYSDIYSTRSTDGGATWSAPKNLTDDDPKQLFGQYYPNITTAPNGRFDVAWYDTRNDPGYRSNDVYYAYSDDAGATWSKNYRISDQPIDRRIGVWSTGYDVTSPPSLASADNYAAFGWDDTRNADTSVRDTLATGGGLQDFFAAAAQFKAVGAGTSKAAKVVLAGVIGLLSVGLILILVAFIARGRTGGPPPRPRAAKKAAAPKPAKV